MNDPAKKKPPRWLVVTCLVVVVLAAVGALFVGWRRHAREARDVQARRVAEDKGPPVVVAKAELSPAERTLALTAEVRALYQTSIYAKVPGYVRAIEVDKGDRVKKGQIMGSIESPPADEAVVAAKADVALKERVAARAQRLAPNVVSEQDRETALANLDVARANLASALATQGYEIIRAPFDGIVTARYVDPGALMPAATGSTQSALPFVDLADPATLRIDVYVGQDAAPFVKDGDVVTIWEDARPDAKRRAPITRTSGALDPRSRTMLCEIQIDNRDGALLPGTFAHVEIALHAPPMPLVPAEALFVRAGAPLVAVVDNDHVRFVKVAPGISNGRTLQIVDGLRGGERVVLGLPTDVSDGGPVQPEERAPAAASSSGTPAPAGGATRSPGTAPRGQTAQQGGRGAQGAR